MGMVELQQEWIKSLREERDGGIEKNDSAAADEFLT